jgi:outer membrane protein assembly factor BamB
MEHSRAALRAGLVLAVAAGVWSLQASTPKFFQAATQTDFLRGELENLSVDSRGQLALGPMTDLVYESGAPFLWTLLPAPDGTLFIGSGNDGKVFRIDPQGRGTLFFDAPELEVHALAHAPNGGVYAATSPDGKIYRIDRAGASTVFFDPHDKYIWSLAADSAGNLFAATGDKGIVYKIDASGKGQPFYQTKATHATLVALDPSGNVIVGTESPGRLHRVDGQGRGFLLLDSPYTEIRTLRFDAKGFMYVAATSGGGSASSASEDRSPDRPSSDSSRPPVPVVTTEVTSVVVADGAGSSAGTTRDDSRAGRGAIYRIAPDGLWEPLWESREDIPYDLTFDREGRLVVATGGKGKLYRLEGDPLRPSLVARAGAQQVTALHRDAKGVLYYTTSNPGKLFRLSAEMAPRGTYESEVRDAKMVASWGNIGWRATVPQGAQIELQTRSGNTETPDEAWSRWSPSYTQSSGSPISSPKARYLQWRAVLTGLVQSPVLTSISAAYLQRNLRPQVRSITVHPPGIVFQKPFSSGDPDLAGFENQTTPDRKLAAAAAAQGSSSALGRRGYEKGLQTLSWRADDENGDELSFDVEYRREGDAAWKVLQRNINETIYVWDTTTVPNGTYFVRVLASDGPSNGPDQALLGELETMTFDIDNSAPVFRPPTTRVEGGRTVVSFEVVDDSSAIERVECSRDGRQWWTVFPRDGIADSRTERYEVAIEGDLGPRGLSIRATDAMNNVATAQVEQPGRR